MIHTQTQRSYPFSNLIYGLQVNQIKNSPTLLLIKWSNILLKQSSYECFCDKGNRVLLLARHVRYQRDMVEVLEQSRGEKVMAGDQTQIYWDAWQAVLIRAVNDTVGPPLSEQLCAKSILDKWICLVKWTIAKTLLILEILKIQDLKTTE